MRDRLIELLGKCCAKYLNVTHLLEFEKAILVDYLLENGVIVPPCKCGDKVYYISQEPLNLSVQANTIYEADVVRIVTTRLGTSLVIQIRNEYGCTEIPDIRSWGISVFATKEEAEQGLKGGEE